MRNILVSTFGAIILLAALSGCTTSVKTDSGHGSPLASTIPGMASRPA